MARVADVGLHALDRAAPLDEHLAAGELQVEAHLRADRLRGLRKYEDAIARDVSRVARDERVEVGCANGHAEHHDRCRQLPQAYLL